MRVKNVVAKSPKELREVLKELKSDFRGNDMLIQLFCSLPKEDFLLCAKIVREIFPSALIVGATSDGEICEGNIHLGSCTASVVEFEKSSVEGMYEIADEGYICGEELGKRVPKDAKLLITFSAGLGLNNEAYLRGLQKHLPQGVHVAGGVAGDLGKFKETYALFQDRLIASGAVVAAIRSNELEVVPFYKFGWKGIGLPHVVTKAQGNRVYEIDGMGVVDFYQHYLGLDLADEFPQTAVEFPLMLQEADGEIARAAVKLYDDGSVGFAGDVGRGSRVKLGVADFTVVINDNAQKVCFSSPPEAFFLYACMARRRFLGKVARMELQPFAKNAPTVGLYTYGEFYTKERPVLFNETLTGIALREKSVERECVAYAPLNPNRAFVKNLRAMWNLIERITQEYQDLLERIEKEKTKIEYLKTTLNKKFSKLFESMREGVVIVDEELQVVEYNSAFAQLVQRDIKSIVEIFDKESLERLVHGKQSAFEAAIEGGKEVLVTYSKLKEEKKNYFLVILTDLSPIKNKERQALEQSKLAQMGEMINMIAHQWRQPLNALSAGAIKLEMKSEIGAARREDIEEFTRFVQKTVQSMSATIETFLNFSKKRNILESFDVSEVIEDALAMIGAQLKARGIAIEKRHIEPIFIKAYKSDLLQILLNLLSNARDVLTKREQEEKRVWIDVVKEGESVIVRIEDNGGGVDEAIVSRIFEPYFTTKGPRGTGLGLYMSKRLAKEKLGGDLEYKKGAKGAIFELRIPVGGGR